MNGRAIIPLLVLGLLLPVLAYGQSSVPNVIGLQQASAESAITASGFVSSVSFEYSAEAEGSVFLQVPSGGTTLSSGGTVRIIVSRGSVTPEAYNYQGMLYVLLGIVGGLAWVAGIRVGAA